MSQDGPKQAQELMSSVPAPASQRGDGAAASPNGGFTEVQKVCYSHEGTLNKFLIDDKGMYGAQGRSKNIH